MIASERQEDLERIERALQAAAAIIRRFSPDTVTVRYKNGGSPVTDADLAADDALRHDLPRPGEGWLSEETPDDPDRLRCDRVWIVDPLDGTRQFLDRVPEWSVSIALAERGLAVAGGIYNPMTDELLLGSPDTGTTLNGAPVSTTNRTTLEGAVVEMGRWAGKRWKRVLRDAGAALRPVGGLAYGLALVAAGRADATWSRSPKTEWDIAAGAALVVGAGGRAVDGNGRPLRFNRWPPRAAGLIASGPALLTPIRQLLSTSAVPSPR